MFADKQRKSNTIHLELSLNKNCESKFKILATPRCFAPPSMNTATTVQFKLQNLNNKFYKMVFSFVSISEIRKSASRYLYQN